MTDDEAINKRLDSMAETLDAVKEATLLKLINKYGETAVARNCQKRQDEHDERQKKYDEMVNVNLETRH